MFGKRLQPRIGSGVDLLDRGGAGGDQRGIDLVVLGPLQVELGIGAHLRRLKHHDNEPLAPQLGDDRLLIAAARLDPDALDLWRRSHSSSTLWPSAVFSTCSCSELPSIATSSFRLPVSIPAQIVVCLAIFVDPPLLCEPKVRSTIRVPMKCRSRSCYVRQPLRLRWASIRSIGGPARAATRAGPFLTERCQYNTIALIQGWAKRSVPTIWQRDR